MNDFLEGLFSSLELVTQWATAELVVQLLHAPYLDLLERGATPKEIADREKLDEPLLVTLFKALEIQGIVEWTDDRVQLAPRARELQRYAGWLTLFVGGYGPLFRNVDGILRGSYEGPRRNGRFVGVGSCLISRYDSIPLTRKLMLRTRPDAKLIVDFGCGNALYLATFCEEFPSLRAIGVEEDAGACAEGRQLIAARGLAGRVSLANESALTYTPHEAPDFIIFAFVLHELVAQMGEDKLVEFLGTIGTRFPETYILVIEVDDASQENPAVFQTPMGRGYYNYYFMLHPFTKQRLLPKARWQELFEQAGLTVIDYDVVDPEIDPSGLEIGYVLRPRRR